MTRKSLLDQSDEDLHEWLGQRGYPSYRAKQIFDWVFDKSVLEFARMGNLPLGLRADLEESFTLGLSRVLAAQVSKDGSTTKYLIELVDGQTVESVLMSYEHGHSICVSSQVGCKIGCAFCASGATGFSRDLSAGEFLLQILVANRDLAPQGHRVSNVVVMGMGEPLDNYDNLVSFIRMAHDESRLAIGYRHITVSTAGIVPKIYQLADLGIPLTLAVSLHAPDDELRSQLMPINRAYPLDQLIDAASYYARMTRRRVTFEYALIEGVNDKRHHAERLASLLSGILCHVNLIPVNPVRDLGFERSSHVEDFRDQLLRRGVQVTVRRELGADIDAACGQLRRRNLSQA